MSAKFSFGKIQFDVSIGPAAAGARHDPEAPFGLAVLGDFSGRSNRSLKEPIGQRRIWHIDCDNFEQVMAKLEVRLRLPLLPRSGVPPDSDLVSKELLELRFATIDDFHPDKLLSQIGPLSALVQQRKRLLQPSTAGAAAAELQTLLANPLPPSPAPAPTPPTGSTEADADTLARLLGGVPQQPASSSPSKTGPGLDRLIHNIVAPSIVPGATPQQAALLSVIDLELTRQVRAVLHHPEFQALEATWRGVDLLVRNFGGEENIKLFLADISKEELAADLRAQEALEQSGLWKLMRHQAEDQPWAVWLGQYTMAGSLGEIELLGRLAQISARAAAPFLSGASPNLADCDSFNAHPDPDDWKLPLPAEVREAWQALRKLPEASHLGLALPRFLLRQPYGKESDPIEAFPFEELAVDAPHEDYLWGNPAVLCSYLLAGAFQAEGWDMRASGYGEVGELPVHKFKENGETKVKPCAEAWLNERAAQVMLDKGLMPVLSIRGRDAVRLEALRSAAGTAFSLR